MIETRNLAELVDLLELAYPDHEPVLVEWHSDRCCTMVAVRPNHHAVRVRWNFGDNQRWTMIPVSESYLLPTFGSE